MCAFQLFLGQELPWRRKWQPTPVFLPGEFQGQSSLTGFSPWDRKELAMTEQLTLSLSLCLSNEVLKCPEQKIMLLFNLPSSEKLGISKWMFFK